MNISKQLMTMLGLSLLGFILIFSISLSKMDQVFEKTNTCNVNSLPSILVMDDLLQGIYRIRLILWETTTSDSHDANEFQKLMERYKTAKTKFDKDYKSYELLLSDAKDKELYEKEGKLFAQYSLVVDQILKLSSEGKLSDAKSLFLANRPTAQELLKTFEDHMDYNQVLASQDAKIAVETKQSATFWMIIIALIISTSVIALSVLIRKNIMQGVHLIRDSITN
ncbi:MAG: MCP four helix bundle domain-containing protein, partial [Sulfurospirillum sp.]